MKRFIIGVVFLVAFSWGASYNPVNITQEDRVLEILFRLERVLNERDLKGFMRHVYRGKDYFLIERGVEKLFDRIEAVSDVPLICIFNPEVDMGAFYTRVRFEFFINGVDKKTKKRICLKDSCSVVFAKVGNRWMITDWGITAEKIFKRERKEELYKWRWE